MNKNALNILQWSLDRAIPGRSWQNCAMPCEPMQRIKSKTHWVEQTWSNLSGPMESKVQYRPRATTSHPPRSFGGGLRLLEPKPPMEKSNRKICPQFICSAAQKKERMSSLSVFIWLSFLSFSLARIWSTCMRIRARARPPEQVASTPSRNECATGVRQVRLNRSWTREQHVMCHAHQWTTYQKTLGLCTTCRTVMSFIDWTWTQGLLRGWPRTPLVRQRWRIVQLRQPWQAKYIKVARPHFSRYFYYAGAWHPEGYPTQLHLGSWHIVGPARPARATWLQHPARTFEMWMNVEQSVTHLCIKSLTAFTASSFKLTLCAVKLINGSLRVVIVSVDTQWLDSEDSTASVLVGNLSTNCLALRENAACHLCDHCSCRHLRILMGLRFDEKHWKRPSIAQQQTTLQYCWNRVIHSAFHWGKHHHATLSPIWWITNSNLHSTQANTSTNTANL